jgi:hypothetical protein
VNFLDFQMIHESEQVVGASRSGAIRGSHGPAVPTAIICDETVACACERRDLMFPHVGAACVSVEKNDRHAATAGVLVKDLRSSNVDESFMKWLWHRLCKCERTSEYDDRSNRRKLAR